MGAGFAMQHLKRNGDQKGSPSAAQDANAACPVLNALPDDCAMLHCLIGGHVGLSGRAWSPPNRSAHGGAAARVAMAARAGGAEGGVAPRCW